MTRSSLLFVFAAAALTGCDRGGDREFEVTDSRVVERELVFGKSTVDRFSRTDPAANPHAHGASPGGSAGDATQQRFAYDLPEGWTEKPLTQFRMASFATPGDGDVSLSTARGGLLTNVNRWRGQFGQERLSPAELEELPQRPLFGRAQAVVVECEGDYQGMGGRATKGAKLLGLVVPINEELMLFVKFTGPAATVDAERDNFFALADSLRLTSASDTAAGAPGDAPSFDPRGMSWDVPSAWEVVPSDSAMRAVTLAPKDHPDVACWVVVLPGEAGGLLPNLNRWLAEVGEKPLDTASLADLPTVTVLGREARMIEAFGDYKGMSGQVEGSGLLGVVSFVGSHTVFIKMVGPADGVRAAKADFIAFCETLEG